MLLEKQEKMSVKKNWNLKIEKTPNAKSTMDELDNSNPLGMSIGEFKEQGKNLIDYICTYLNAVSDYDVIPKVQPGFLQDKVCLHPPMQSNPFPKVVKDFKKRIFPASAHWQSPGFKAYFSAPTTPASLLGELLCNAINTPMSTWSSCPAGTELHTVVTDWVARALGLPESFCWSPINKMQFPKRGGGILLPSVSEATLMSMLVARYQRIDDILKISPSLSIGMILDRLVSYVSDQSHATLEKVACVSMVKLRCLPTDENHVLRADTLAEAMAEDVAKGLVPFFVCATLGTSNICAFDPIDEIGPICAKFKAWLHVDAAYAGTAFVCPEYRVYLNGIDLAKSFTINLSKWMPVAKECSCLHLQDVEALRKVYSSGNELSDCGALGKCIDLFQYQVSDMIKEYALKLWFTMKSFGIDGLQAHVRRVITLANLLESFVQDDSRFELPIERTLSVVAFRLKGPNIRTEVLLKRINQSGKLYCSLTSLKGNLLIRYVVNSTKSLVSGIREDWGLIQRCADQILSDAKFVENILPLRETLITASAKPSYEKPRSSQLSSLQELKLLPEEDAPTIDPQLIDHIVGDANVVDSSYVAVMNVTEENDVNKVYTSEVPLIMIVEELLHSDVINALQETPSSTSHRISELQRISEAIIHSPTKSGIIACSKDPSSELALNTVTSLLKRTVFPVKDNTKPLDISGDTHQVMLQSDQASIKSKANRRFNGADDLQRHEKTLVEAGNKVVNILSLKESNVIQKTGSKVPRRNSTHRAIEKAVANFINATLPSVIENSIMRVHKNGADLLSRAGRCKKDPKLEYKVKITTTVEITDPTMDIDELHSVIQQLDFDTYLPQQTGGNEIVLKGPPIRIREEHDITQPCKQCQKHVGFDCPGHKITLDEWAFIQKEENFNPNRCYCCQGKKLRKMVRKMRKLTRLGYQVNDPAALAAIESSFPKES